MVERIEQMSDDEIIKFTQFCLDRFTGHQLTDQIIRNALRDYQEKRK